MRTRVVLTLLTIPAVLGQAAFGQLTQGERDRAMSHLHATRKAFLDSIEGLSEAQWRFKPDAKAWSVAEVSEHIALSEESLAGLVRQKILKTPPAPEKTAEVAGKDEIVMKAIPDRSHKATAPEFLRPTGKWTDSRALAADFRQKRDELIRYIQTTQDNLRHHVAPHPAVGPIDAYQWVLLIAAHTERHVAQIAEVKSSPSFPGR
jgi:hypothetical protein